MGGLGMRRPGSLFQNGKAFGQTGNDLLNQLGFVHFEISSLLLIYNSLNGSSKGRVVQEPGAINRANNPENRFSVLLFLTAIPKAFRCPISTTNFLPRVMPVYPIWERPRSWTQRHCSSICCWFVQSTCKWHSCEHFNDGCVNGVCRGSGDRVGAAIDGGQNALHDFVGRGAVAAARDIHRQNLAWIAWHRFQHAGAAPLTAEMPATETPPAIRKSRSAKWRPICPGPRRIPSNRSGRSAPKFPPSSPGSGLRPSNPRKSSFCRQRALARQSNLVHNKNC